MKYIINHINKVGNYRSNVQLYTENSKIPKLTYNGNEHKMYS